jgi:hypothetical protein
MKQARIEDDSDLLKVPADEIPPVRQPDVAAHIDTNAAAASARVLGTSSTMSAPTSSTPRQIPGLAFRTLHKPEGPKGP